MERPDIFRHIEYRNFLRDHFEYLQSKSKKYSQRWVAAKAGWKSPQLLSMILKGDRKLSIEHAKLLSLAFGLSEKEEEYLLILIELESASGQDKQLEILDRIRFQFQNGLFKDLPDTGFEYLKKWYYAAIREMTSMRSFRIDASSIAKALDITNEDAAGALDFLLKSGLLKQGENGFERSEPSLKASDYVSPLIMMQYHLQVLERAFKAVQISRDLRHFESLVVALSLKDIEPVREKIRQFVREIDMLAEGSARRDDVFQLSIQFFSLTAGRVQEVSK